ncbi:MAG: hypothetical protein RIB65_08975 [Ilumatobacter fluminis]|uniref:Uncharacterized protein n=1 Tax=Ilumatobacter fluminis TaxID=467091 RepID=A0A4R7HX23_9ACTN|nr:hypothetical protein [Ilumatobacter fluminis]TDT15702.1 hypothetical protein BDK89_1278 [Ilumatobacter fluminis]
MTEHERIRWAKALVFGGWMFVLAFIGILVIQVRRAAAVSDSRFEDGVWGQRAELVSFATLPQNAVVVVPALIAGLVAAWLVRPLVDPIVVHTQWLLRIIAGLAYVILALAVLGILAVFFQGNFDSVGDVGSILGRLGGVAVGLAIVRLCTEAEHDT